MQCEPAAKLRGGIGLILLVAAAAAVWWGLDRLEPRADWLRVEAPRRAVAGQRLPLRVHLTPLTEPTLVCADLHWGTTRDTPVGYLATGGSRAVGREGGTFDFEIAIPPTEGLRFVTGIIFLSRTGSWHDHTRVAATEVIPVSSHTVGTVERRLDPLRVRPLGDEADQAPRPAAIPRWLTALLFLAAAVAAWGGGQSLEGSNGEPGPGTRWWQGLAVLLAMACLWELFGLESPLGAQARAMARAGDFYYPRAAFQKAVISVAVTATAVFLFLVRRERGSRWLLLSGLGLYIGISAVNLVSLHGIDKVAGLSWHGLTLVQALKTGCASMTLRGVASACRMHRSDGL
jgi:hypothetical protein